MTLLHLDASPRESLGEKRGSHTRRMSARFVARWRAAHPGDCILRRDLALTPPAMVSEAFIAAAFTPPAARTEPMRAVLRESDALVDELLRADVIVAGVPMHNFGPPAVFKAYIDNVVRVGRTFGFDRTRSGEPYWPLLAGEGKRLVVLSARGDFGYDPGQRLAHMNHVEPSIRTAFAYVGITDFTSIAIEYDEFGDERLAASVTRAEAAIDALVDRMLRAQVSLVG